MSHCSSPNELPLTVVEADRGWQGSGLGELWRYRELLYFFAWRDVKVRYKQTELGAAWAILQPLLTTLVFVVLFQVILPGGKGPTIPGLPYVLATLAGMLPWQLFAESLTRSSESLIEAQNLITKVYFPRVLLPASAVIGSLVDFAIGLGMLGVIMAIYGRMPSWTLVTLPVFIVLAALASLAAGLWLSTLSAVYRDFRYVQPFLIRLGMFLSPVVYPTLQLEDKVPDWALVLYGLNPMVAAIEGFRWALFATPLPGPLVMLPSIATTAALLVGGLYFFQQMETTVVDVI
jgi:lipopolysaccharide transport system permease protein